MSKGQYYIWSAIGQYGTQVIGFVGNILIARILMPEDYGLIALLAIVVGLSMTFTDSGFADCLIRKTDADKVDFGTVATFNITVAGILYLLIFILAPLIAEYFQHHELIEVTRVISLSIVIKALTLTPITKLRKDLRFKSLALMQSLSSIISISLTYIIARKGYGYWALALQPVFIAMANMAYLVIVIKWVPFFRFNITRFKGMFEFSVNLLISYLVNQIGQNLYSIIIGKNYTVSSLGYYNQAKRMYEVPTQGLNSVVLTTSYSIIAKEVDKERQKSIYLGLARSFLTIQSGMVLILIGIAEPVWLFLLGDKWISSVPYFKLFMVISLVYPLVTVNSNIAKVSNKPRLYRNLTILRNLLQVTALLICAKESLEIILYGQIIAAYISVSVDMVLCGNIIQFGFYKQFKLFLFTVYKPIAAYLIAYIFCHYIDLSKYIEGVIFFLVFILSISLVYYFTKDKVVLEYLHDSKSAAKTMLMHLGRKL